MTARQSVRLAGLAGGGFLAGAAVTVAVVLACDALIRAARRVIEEAS